MARNCVTLLSGYQMPLIGLGTYKILGYETIYSAIDSALAAGYRSFDTAAAYRNESDLGKVFKVLLPKHNLKREDIFIITKLAPEDHGKDQALSACLASIERLDCSYLDLYLVHWPGASNLKPQDAKHKQYRKETWEDLETAVKNGKVRSIGISNYLFHHLEELFSYCTIKPSVLQTEYHPHLRQDDVKKFCFDHGVHFQAYSSLGASKEEKKLLNDPIVLEVGKSVNKSPPQVLLRWALQQNIGVLPRSTNPKHIAENMESLSFTLSEEQMEALNSLDHQHHYIRDPSHVA